MSRPSRSPASRPARIPRLPRQGLFRTILVGITAAVMAATVGAAPAAADRSGSGHSGLFPKVFPLPNNFQPEGIAIGPGPFAYFGSRRDGSIYRASLITGRGKVIEGTITNTPSVGVKTDKRGRIFVAGGRNGDARVVDTRTGDILARYQFATGDTFVNDVVLAYGAAWFTDSRIPVLYKLPLGRHGALPTPAQVVRVPLTGAIVYGEGNNANGIAPTPDRKGLLIVQSNTGFLFRVNPGTGVTTAVDLGGENLMNGDGLLLRGRTLYAVQNRLNQVAVLSVDRSATSARLVTRVTHRTFDVPTTVAAFKNRLYLPNARFNTTPTPQTRYWVTAIPRP